MGAVVSCFQTILGTIGNVIMTIVRAIGAVIMAIVNGIVALFDIIISCLTCGKAGGRRNRMKTSHHTSRV
ncbi:uncharacterized protein BDZ99DRAFT_462906 [Mytilinidion resinicola]|uniref:Uncharacterized protein n=1 Tax=Mytilinidion resinicola TaxID=574789 RepID=A0A6A6YN61_9PEZI|nr:uncharacterized protein BDZ99DRAFT_462906 [Mytilinidion resinicola]KAF2810326.1 hypothetical protein BDZ99DRAFT_462906 [Mytilinidion resinicola]